ncbi:MAG: bifunctional diguanylate cyclase/phosphodiesterase [Treponema sp.]|nr:bifunctional diguanylate cyclase/phosphodiesterase [Treponema sp.]
MKKKSNVPDNSKNIDNTLKNIYKSKGNPKFLFVLLLFLYAIAYFFVIKAALMQGEFTIFGGEIPYAIFAGVFTTFANFCIIFLVLLFKKAGFFTALTILVVQFPMIIVNLFIRHAVASIPGAFTDLFTIVIITIIYLNNLRISRYQEEIRNQAITDMLTKLPNRFACTELSNELIKKNEKFAIISIDLNNFKKINDTMGHEAGDKVLIDVSKRWRALADSRFSGTTDFLARLGGDEFALIVRDYNSCLDIINTVDAYETELEKKFTIDDCDYFITASFGYAEFPIDADNTISLLSCSAAALHEVERLNNSNKILRYTHNLLKTEQILETERKIRYALENDAVFIYLQPQYNSEHKLRGFEALARMKDLDGSFISPVDFIPVAERVGLVDKIDMLVFRRAAEFLADILKQKQIDIIISSNISVRHLMKNNFIDEIKGVLQETGVPANHFEIEITESIMIDSDEKALKCINEIKNMGIKVAIDDFGTGYSSLSYLNKFPADMLKIDKSFIDVMNTNDSSKKYVATIISIGHIMNLQVISEGVESDDQLETLKEIGGDYIQGYIWGRPMPPEQAARLVL